MRTSPSRPQSPTADPQRRGIDKRYGQREALRGVSFDVRPGELVAVVGPNGAGKTTLLSILAGVQRPSGGSVDGPRRQLRGRRARSAGRRSSPRSIRS